MRVAINASLLSGPLFGITTYIDNLIKNIQEIGAKNEYIIVGKDKMFRNSVSRIIWEQFAIPYLANKHHIDVFHNPDHILPLLPVKCKKVITVHDLAFLKHPETFSFKKRFYKTMITPSSIKKADKIIAVSNNTKKDIVELFKASEEKVRVVYNGINPSFAPMGNIEYLQKIKSKHGLNKPFILFVGSIEPRKNISGLIKAYASIKRTNKIEHNLIIVGKKGWLYEEIFKSAGNSGVSNNIRFLNYVPFEDLPAIYNCADAFVYPSLYEGFGFPPLEAMACGVPVITSNTSSLPEVAGDAAILVDPLNSDEIADSIEKVLNSSDIRIKMKQKGIDRAKLFSWEKCARETIKVYEEAAR